jgi:putative hydrolase of the HAD superfamily
MSFDPKQVETWIFDLDNTLYHAADFFPQITGRIREYTAKFLGLGPEEAHAVQKNYLRRYGTTMNGLMAEHGLDPGPYLDYVHDVDFSRLGPDPELSALIEALPGRKLIYTNGSRGHAKNVLTRLEMTHHFEATFDIIAAGYRPKPAPEPYRQLCERHDVEPSRAVFIEDTARNLAPAAALGMTTVWLRHDDPDTHYNRDESAIHHEITDLKAWLGAFAGKSAAPEN